MLSIFNDIVDDKSDIYYLFDILKFNFNCSIDQVIHISMYHK